ncbi:MAG TPA: glycosyltransferase [Caulobacteraceae bacterium]|nr:glycosyltransferase [Caulobacteraceae bacterium]
MTPALIVARALQDRGRRVLVVSDACNAPDAEGFGVPFEPWRTAPNRPDKRPETDPLRDYEAGSPAEMIDRLCERVICGPAPAYARNVRAVLGEHPGAVLVSQELLFGAMVGAEASGAPWALLTANLWPFPTLPGVPPFGAGFEPAADEAGRARDDMVRTVTLQLYDRHLQALNDARAGEGLEPLDALTDQPLRARRILLGVARAFDFLDGEPPEPFRYVGPQIADPAWVEPWASPWPQDDDRPLVLVSFSTFFQGQTEAIRNVARALAGLPVRGLVLTGPAVEPAEIETTENVRAVRSAPFDQVLEHAALVVTHAGHGSAVRPLMKGVPLVCLPMGRDQPDNAARAANRGAGVVLSPYAPPDEIAAAVERVLSEPAYRQAAATLGRAIIKECGPDTAADELEALASKP